jgi:hypothetical protein
MKVSCDELLKGEDERDTLVEGWKVEKGERRKGSFRPKQTQIRAWVAHSLVPGKCKSRQIFPFKWQTNSAENHQKLISRVAGN